MRAVFCFFLLLIACPTLPHADGAEPSIDTSWRAKAANEGRAAWERYTGMADHLQEDNEMKVQLPPNSKIGKNKIILTKMSRDGQRSLFERATIIDNDSTRAQKTVECINEQYRFAASQSGPASPFVMTSYSPLRPEDKPPGIGFSEFAYAELTFLLSAIDGREGFVLTGLDWDAKKQLLHASLKRHNGKTSDPPLSHELWLDPANHWRIVERHQIAPSTTLLIRMTYGQHVDDLSYPIKIDQTTIRQRGSTSETSEIEITLKVSRAARPESDYRLSGYGLPEPVDVPAPPARRTPNYLWLLSGALLCLVIAVVSRYLLMRKRRLKVQNDS